MSGSAYLHGIRGILLFLAFFTLRLFLLANLRVAWTTGYALGLGAGLLADLSIALIPLALGTLARAALPRNARFARWFEISLTLFVWLLNATNIGYISFFHKPFELWELGAYTGNAWEVRGAILHLLAEPHFIASFLFCLAAIWRVPRGSLGTAPAEPGLGPAEPASPTDRLRQLACGLALCVGVGIIRQSPVWFRLPRVVESAFSDNVVWTLGEEVRRGEWHSDLPLAAYEAMLPRAPEILRKFSALDESGNSAEVSVAERARALRVRFGLPPGRPPNIIILFLESGRAYELLHPRIGGEAYPHLKAVLAEHAVFFPETYSTANYTVQGQFSTLCGRMDRADAPPVYNRQSYLKQRCLPSVLTDVGYETYWMNPFHKFFGGKFVFESNHGMQQFLDRDFFKARNPGEERGATEWGIRDEVFLDQALTKLEAISASADGHPFFAHLLTTGTHAPWHFMTDPPLPDPLSRLAGDELDYRNYLSSVHALDQALATFFTRFFRSPLADHTLLVVMGDHGTGVEPAKLLTSPLERQILWHRIILGFVSKGLAKPETRPYPIHQIDIAPFLADLAGAPHPPSPEWLGRDPLLETSGTAWVKRSRSSLIYRTQDRVCLREPLDPGPRCWAAPAGTDPLFRTGSAVPNDPALSGLMTSVVDANEAALELAK